MEGYMKMFEALGQAFDSLLPKDKDSLGWEEFKCMTEKFAPMQDKAAGGHWIWDDSTAKASFDYGVGIYGDDGRFSFSQFMSYIQ